MARWRGFGGATNFNGACYETFTWAAGVGGATEHATVFATSHVPTIHPIVAAKQATTIDHISNGRFALNLVMGEMSEVVLSSLRVSANKVLQTGFTFEYNYLEEALASFYKEEKD